MLTEDEKAELTRKGAVITTVQHFLGLSDIEMQIIEIRRKLAREVRQRRKAAKMTQKTLAQRMNVAQPRIPGIESGTSASLDMLVSAFLATGATLADLGAVFSESAPPVSL